MSHRLPSRDLLRGFEAAARQLSFTKAALELSLTQSAVSRQIQTLEEQLGCKLFERGHREIRLTRAGMKLSAAAATALQLLGDAVAEIDTDGASIVTVSCTMGFAALWLVPRLMVFRAERPHADIRIAANNSIVDLERESVELAVRYCPADLAPAGAQRLFGEEVFAVCAPDLRGIGGQALRVPADLRHHVLLEQEDAATQRPSASWTMWLEAVGLQRLKPGGTLKFSHYDQLIQAAIDGQSVALAISPLVGRHLSERRLIAPFEQRIATPRAYQLVTAGHAAGRPDVMAFVEWLLRNASQEGSATSPSLDA